MTLVALAGVDGQNFEETKINVEYLNKPLDLVLLDLELKYRIKFEVDASLIEDRAVTGVFKRISLDDALTEILAGSGLQFELAEGRLIKLYQGRANHLREGKADKPRKFDFNLSGVVRDGETGETLPFATIVVKGSTQGTETNVDGHFTLFNVPNDTVKLTVNYLGYQVQDFQLHPRHNIQRLLIDLTSNAVALDEVLISATSDEQLISASTGISRISMAPDAIMTLPSYGEKDVFRSLQLLPGVSGSNESSAGLFVRGGTPDQNLILFDGITVYHVDHLFGFFSAFNANAIKGIQLHKGGFDAKYGGRLSSVVDITGKDGNTEQFNMGAGISLLSYNGYVEAPFAAGRGSVLVAARRSFQSNFYSNLFDAFAGANANNNAPQGPLGRGGFGQQTAQPNSYFYDLNAKVTYRLGSNDIFSLSFYNGEDDLDNSRRTDSNSFGGFGRFGGGNNNFSFNSDNVDLSNWGNVGTSLKWSRKWSDRFYTNANVSYSNYFSERDRRNETTINREDTTFSRVTGSYELNDLRDFTLKIDNEIKISQQNQLEFGIQSTNNDIEYEFTQNDTISLINRDDQELTFSTYLQDKHTFGEKLILKGGIRGTSYSATKDIYLEPRISFTYLLSDRIKFKGAYGKYYQFANRIVREDIQQGSRDFWLLSDGLRVPIGSSIHYIAGLAYEDRNFLIDVEAYRKDLDGLSEYSTRFTTSGFGPTRTLDYEEFFFNGTGFAEGIEFLLQKKSGRVNGWLGYTLGRVRYDFNAFGDESFPANQDQTHELKLILNYKLGRWDVAGTFIYATGRPYTAPTGFYEIPLLDGTMESYFEVSSKNGLRLPDYHRLDLSATYNFKLGESRASAGLSLINLYNRTNIWYKEYEVIEGELLVTDISLIDFTPSLFLKWDLN